VNGRESYWRRWIWSLSGSESKVDLIRMAWSTKLINKSDRQFWSKKGLVVPSRLLGSSWRSPWASRGASGGLPGPPGGALGGLWGSPGSLWEPVWWIWPPNHRYLSIRLLYFLENLVHSLSVCYALSKNTWCLYPFALFFGSKYNFFHTFRNLASLSIGLHIFDKTMQSATEWSKVPKKVTLPLQRRRHTFTLAYTDCLFLLEFASPLYPFAHFAMLHRK
jgi:hypothetical protein